MNKLMILGLLVFLFDLSLSNAADTAENILQDNAIFFEPVICLQCADIASPSDCREIMMCGKGEICYTREFIDHRGLQAFRMGCEDETRCNLFLNAQHLFGKRDEVNFDPAPSNMCYGCCKGVECNGQLCQGKGSVHIPEAHHTTTPCPTCTCPTTNSTPCTCPRTTYPTTTNTPCPQTTCPTSTGPTIAHQAGSGSLPFSVAYKDKYYFFSSNMRGTWDKCRTFCKSFDADLVSINSQDEQEFLVQQLNKSGCPSYSVSWTGGAYSHSLHEWEWVDRSPVLYTHWQSGFPGTLSPDTDDHILMYNPSCSSAKEKKEGRWLSVTGAMSTPFICEKQTI